MIQNPKQLILSNKQKEWLNELLTCISYNLIPKPPRTHDPAITQTLFAGFYYENERDTLNEYLKKYPLPLLRKLLRERK